MEYFHPAFLYESLWDIFVFLLLFFVVRKIAAQFTQNAPGMVFFSYLALYSIGRIFIENIRTDSVLNVFGVPVAVLVSILILFASVILLIWTVLRYKKPANV